MDLTAYVLNGPRRGLRLTDGDAIARALEADELAWVHLRADDPATRDWIAGHLDYLDPQAIDALTAQETRPRALGIGQGTLMNLRGVNTNDASEPEDLVSIRMWLDPNRIVTLSLRPLRCVDELRTRIAAKAGPEGPGSFLADIVVALTQRIEGLAADLDDRVDQMEEDVLEAPNEALRQAVLDVRQDVIGLRRFLIPQRDALAHLGSLQVAWLSGEDRRRLAEEHDDLMRTVEDLDAMRERLTAIRDELQSGLSDRLNRNLYVLSVVSTIFLPLGFLTGLMGVNLAGMPGAAWAPAFWVFTAGLVVAACALLALFRYLRWL